jgi:hypothetical protein
MRLGQKQIDSRTSVSANRFGKIHTFSHLRCGNAKHTVSILKARSFRRTR